MNPSLAAAAAAAAAAAWVQSQLFDIIFTGLERLSRLADNVAILNLCNASHRFTHVSKVRHYVHALSMIVP